MTTRQFVRIQSVEPLDGFHVRLGFTDNTQRIIDLEPYLHGPIFALMRDDPASFRSVRVDKRLSLIHI